jgi:isoleucyl-tRNA synthetase
LLQSLGNDLKFVFIVSSVRLVNELEEVQRDDFNTAFDFQAGEFSCQVLPSTATKCERCWHYADDVGSHAGHPTLCGRCVSNLAEAAGTGAGEQRVIA